MAIYVTELCIIFLLGFLLKGKYISKKVFVILSFAVMAIVLGLRGNNVGEDTKHFIDIFNCSKNISWRTAFTSGADTVYKTIWGVDLKVETGYILLNKVVGVFTANGQWIIFIVAVLTCWLVGKFILDNISTPFFPTYIFMCEGLYMQSFNLMRQMLAISIVIQSYKYIRNEKYKKAILIILIAFMIHKTAAIFILLLPLQLIKKNQRIFKYIVLGGASISFFLPILSQIILRFIPRYASYFTTNYWEANIGFGNLLLWSIEILICMFIYFKSKKDINKEKFIILSCIVFYLSFELIGLKLTVFSRIALNFRMFLLLLFPLFTRYFSKDSQIWYKLGIILIVTISFLSYASATTRVYSFFWN